MQVSLRVLMMATTLYSVAFKAAGQVVSVTRLNCRLTCGLVGPSMVIFKQLKYTNYTH